MLNFHAWRSFPRQGDLVWQQYLGPSHANPDPDRKHQCMEYYDRGSAQSNMSCDVHMWGEGHGTQEMPWGRGVTEEMKGSFSVGKEWALRRGRRGAMPQTLFPARNKDKQTARKIIKPVPGAAEALVPTLLYKVLSCI